MLMPPAFRHAAQIAAPALVLALLPGCAGLEPPPAPVQATGELAYIKITRDDPGPSCQYLGEALSIGGAYGNGFDPLLIKKTMQALSDEREDAALREYAKKLGANVVFMNYIHDTAYAVHLEINTFHKC
jgi:hypothetical protein